MGSQRGPPLNAENAENSDNADNAQAAPADCGTDSMAELLARSLAGSGTTQRVEHVLLGTHRDADAVDFYRRVLAPLGLDLQRDSGAEAAFGTSAHWSLFLYPVPAADQVTARGMHLALGASSRDQVGAVHQTALAAGAQDLFTPRERPDISATCFGAMFIDLDGHGLEILTNATE